MKFPVPPGYLDLSPFPEDVWVGNVYFHTYLGVEVRVTSVNADGEPHVTLLADSEAGFTKGETYWPDTGLLRIPDLLADLDCGEDEGA